MRQSRPDSGLDLSHFPGNTTFQVVPSSPGRGQPLGSFRGRVARLATRQSLLDLFSPTLLSPHHPYTLNPQPLIAREGRAGSSLASAFPRTLSAQTTDLFFISASQLAKGLLRCGSGRGVREGGFGRGFRGVVFGRGFRKGVRTFRKGTRVERGWVGGCLLGSSSLRIMV